MGLSSSSSASRVEGTGADREVLRPGGHETPSRDLEPPRRGLGLGGVEDDRDTRGRCDVVRGLGEIVALDIDPEDSDELGADVRHDESSAHAASLRAGSDAGGLLDRLARADGGARVSVLKDPDAFEAFQQRRAVGSGDPRHRDLGVIVDDRASTGQHRLRGRQAPDRHARDIVGILAT